MADVIASGWCYCHICRGLMLLPWWLMLYPPMGEMADVVAMVAWWNSHWVNLILIQMLCVGPHPIYQADVLTKLQDNPTLWHHLVLEMIGVNIFLRPGRSHVWNWQKLVSQQNLSSVFEKIFKPSLYQTEWGTSMLKNRTCITLVPYTMLIYYKSTTLPSYLMKPCWRYGKSLSFKQLDFAPRGPN